MEQLMHGDSDPDLLRVDSIHSIVDQFGASDGAVESAFVLHRPVYEKAWIHSIHTSEGESGVHE